MNWAAWGKSWLVAVLGIALSGVAMAFILGWFGVHGDSEGQTLVLVALGGVLALPWIGVQAYLWDRWDR